VEEEEAEEIKAQETEDEAAIQINPRISIQRFKELTKSASKLPQFLYTNC